MKNLWKLNDRLYTSDELLEILKAHETVIVGSDSKYFSQFVKYASVICVFSNPGITYWYQVDKEKNKPGDIRTRIWTEVQKSVDIALWLQDCLPTTTITVHCDINSDPRFASNRFQAEAMGYVTGCGFKYVGKPDSWAASGAADWHTK